MDKEKISRALTDGLVAGYAGDTEFSSIKRSNFDIKSSHLESEDFVYHDEWTKGGGQEIIKVGQDLFTRVYAGGVANEEVLEKLNITHQDVIANLMTKIQQLGKKTRLFSDCFTDSENNWKYEYKILDQDNQLLITTGKEIIKYKNQIVFTHVFVLSPIK